MVISSNPVSVSGRILDPPNLTYGTGQVVRAFAIRLDRVLINLKRPKDGAWNVVGQKLHTPKDITCWALVNFCPSIEPQKKLLQDLMKCCSTLGRNSLFHHYLLRLLMVLRNE